MRVRGRYAYKPHFADRPIESPITWQRWITDAPGGGSGDGGGGGDGDPGSGYESDRSIDYGMGDSEGARDTGISDLSKTVVLKRPNRAGEREGDTNTADLDFQSNAHTSRFRPLQFVRHQYRHSSIPNPVSVHPDQDPTTADADTACNLHENKQPTTIVFRDPIANPSELEALMHSARQQTNWKATVIEGESWEGNAEENTAKYQRVMPPIIPSGPPYLLPQRRR
jgi:hypothetical protein